MCMLGFVAFAVSQTIFLLFKTRRKKKIESLAKRRREMRREKIHSNYILCPQTFVHFTALFFPIFHTNFANFAMHGFTFMMLTVRLFFYNISVFFVAIFSLTYCTTFAVLSVLYWLEGESHSARYASVHANHEKCKNPIANCHRAELKGEKPHIQTKAWIRTSLM